MSPRPKAHVPRGPFFRPLDVDDVPDQGLDTSIEATPDELGAIAEAQGLPAVASLAARFHAERRAGGRVVLSGGLTARITQICVVSLDPFESDIAQPIEVVFAPQDGPDPAARPLRTRDREHPAPPARRASPPGSDDQQDPPDPIIDGTIDLGAVTLEFLTLSLDLYPRKPGVRFSDVVGGGADEAEPSPFAALERFKDRT